MNYFFRLGFLLFASLYISQAFAQQYPYSTSQTTARLKKHVTFLADDKLEGRLVGSEGEQKASAYISEYFKKNKIKPVGKQADYLQAFTFKRLTYTSTSSLAYQMLVGSQKVLLSLPLSATLYPVDFSGMGSIKAPLVNVGFGITTEDSVYDDYKNVGVIKGKIVSINAGYPLQGFSKEWMKDADLESRADNAIRRGVAGIIFYAADSSTAFPVHKSYFTYTSFHGRKSIPIVFSAQANLSLGLVNEPYQLTVDTVTQIFEGHNVIGYIDNGAPKTVVIGAHYDHLGYNELGGSTFVSGKMGEKYIHNGADDNASGTAALLELSKALAQSEYTHSNYLLVAFSGEEEGLLGSNYLVNHLPIKKSSINYMINMDMVGRLDTVKNSFAISGTGTSPVWQPLLDSMHVDGLRAKYTQSGSGSSDHTSFYVNGIPVLHYFTGSHADYHKPSDDAQLLNYEGMTSIVKHIYTLVGNLDKRPKLTYAATKEDTTVKTSFKVTLGIMPDYLYEGKGVKVDGVTPGKPAALAGLQKGDIILRLGDISIEDMTGYMKALGKFSKGQTTSVNILRGASEVKLDVTF